MPKEKVKLDNDTTAMIKALCVYYGMSVEELIVKLVNEDFNKHYKDIIRHDLA